MPAQLQQTSIDKFFGNKITMAKCKVKPAAARAKKGSRAPVGVTSTDAAIGSHESVFPTATEDDETSSNKSCRGIFNSLSSTPATSAVNTPEPIVNATGRARLSRTAKKPSVSLVASASCSSELDADSVSDFVASANQSDAVTETESATECQTTEDTDTDDYDHVILPAQKRINLRLRSVPWHLVSFTSPSSVSRNTDKSSYPRRYR
jgi:hypothetical protein